MDAGVFIGRLSPLAAAAGVGLAITFGGAPVAVADSTDSDASSSDAGTSASQRSEGAEPSGRAGRGGNATARRAPSRAVDTEVVTRSSGARSGDISADLVDIPDVAAPAQNPKSGNDSRETVTEPAGRTGGAAVGAPDEEAAPVIGVPSAEPAAASTPAPLSAPAVSLPPVAPVSAPVPAPVVIPVVRPVPAAAAAARPAAVVQRATADAIGGLLPPGGLDGGDPATPAAPSPADVLAVAYVRREAAAAAATNIPVVQQLSAQAVGSNPLRDFIDRITSMFRNQAPTAQPTQTGQSAGVISGRLNATDANGDPLTYSVSTQPTRGTVTVAADGSYTYQAPRTVALTGTTDSFRVTIRDDSGPTRGLAGLLRRLLGGNHSTVVTVAVSVAPFSVANQAPTGTVQGLTSNSVTGVVTGRVVGSDADGDSLTYTTPSTTGKGSVGIDSATGSFTFTPTATARQNAGAEGATDADRRDSFTVTIVDGMGGTTGVAVTVPVVPVAVVNPDPDPDPDPNPGGPLAAFPGAEGFGANATGGRGGSVIYVTNLNADGPGSLQWAIDQPGAKYILFKVSGVINSQIHLTNGDVTIAGQTSPGGITIRGLVTDETPYQDQAVRQPADFAENWILQHIRIRPADGDISDDGLRIRYTRNGIVDHVSIGNAHDEAIEISYSNNITVQNTVIAETIGGHSFYGGVLMNYSNPAYGFALDNVSLHHNIFNRIEGRLPEGSRESGAAARSFMNLELSNNVYWDPNFFVALGVDTAVAGGAPIYWNLNAVNNYFHVRNGFPYGMFDDQILRVAQNNLFVSGNQMNLYPGRSDYQLFYCCNDYPRVPTPNQASSPARKLTTRNPFPAITYTPTDQLVDLLLNTAGAWPRDPMDDRLMRSVATRTIASAPRNTNPAGDALRTAYSGAAPAAPVDTDNDGMPDAWETARGLNPNVANANGHALSTIGYTDLEVYLHELSNSRITGWAG